MLNLIKNKIDTFIKSSHWYNEILFKDCVKFWDIKDELLDVVNLGSSSGVYDFNYSETKYKAMNWAIAPQSTIGDFLVLKTFRKYLKNNAIVFYPICPFTAISGGVDYIEDRCYSFLDYKTIPGGHYIRNSKVMEQKEHPIQIYPLVEFIRDIKLHIIPPKKRVVSDVQLEKDAERWIKGWTEQFNITNLNKNFISDHQIVYNRTIAVFQEMANYCKAESLRLIFVVPPMHKSLCNKFSNQAKEQLIDTFISQANNDNVLYIDSMDNGIFSNDASLFCNSYFLNKKGAVLFTNYIINKINAK